MNEQFNVTVHDSALKYFHDIDKRARQEKIAKILGRVAIVAVLVAPVAYVVVKTKQAVDECDQG